MKRILIPTLAATALVLSACAGGGTAGTSAAGGGKLADGKTFTMSLTTDPGNLDPMMTVLSVTRAVDRFLYGRLLEVQEDGSVIAGLAGKWSGDTTNATFTLREGVTCADGTPLTAGDVAANVNFIGDPANKSPLTGLWVQPGTKAVADEATRTITVKSGAPSAFLLLNVGTLPIACGPGLKDRKLLAKGDAGTGMFTMTEIVPNDHYTLTRRKDFKWGPGDWDPNQQGLPDKVVFKIIPNETTSVNLLLSGGLNATSVLGPDQERLSAQKLFHSDLAVPLGQLYFNQAPGRPAKDQAVRRALTQALDLGKVGKVLTNGKGTPATGLVTIAPNPCRGDHVTGNLPTFDAAAAKTAFDSAGWIAGADGIRAKDGKKLALTLIYGTQGGPTATAAAELIQQQWKALGVEATLKAVDSTGLNEVLFSTGAWDASIAPVSISLPSQFVPFASGAVPPKGVNFAHIDNKGYIDGVGRAGRKPGVEGCADWTAAEVSLFKSVDVVPFVNATLPYFGKGAEFKADDGVDPASIRMFE
ncbi:ABC transporter substrate-binding protein [Kribbella sp. NBC_01245]|uniref:ABC transporter substrate-binding protein n=1 Tax=Kribbella sp. NBC_01245 TaxID=2903578 RepID=UPI002E2AA808|nr:ABC transporter substrate-binding protein [Kribbella sp. NBC_01245]